MRGLSTTLALVWQQRLTRSFALLLLAPIPVLLLAPVSLAFPLLFWHCAGIVVLLLLAQALQQQNQPSLARLVPGQQRCLRRQQLALWGAGLVSQALPYAAFGVGPLVAATVAAAMVVPTFMALVGTRLRMWLPLLLLALLAMVGSLAQARHWGGMPLAVSLLALLLVPPVLLVRLIRSGDAQHQTLYRQRRALYASADLLAAAEAQQRAFMPGRLSRILHAGFWRHWRTLVHAPSPATALPRLSLALLSTSHWRGVLPLYIAVGLFSALTASPAWLPALAQGQFGEWVQDKRWMVLLWLVWLPLLSVLQAPAGLRLSRREQAVLALLPGLPPRPQLAKAWVGLLLRTYLRLWFAVALLSLLVLAPGGAETTGLWALSLSLMLMASLTLAAPNKGAGSDPVTWVCLGLGATLLVGTQWGGWPALPLAAAVLALTAVGWARRWPRLAHAPAPIPLL